MFTNPSELIAKYKTRKNSKNKYKTDIIDFHVVTFNAWAYIGTDHLWAGLITHLYQEEEKSISGTSESCTIIGKQIKKSAPKSIRIVMLYAL